MRAAFTILILCLSAFYTYWAFADLTFLSSTGRLGPGFFPRIIGIGLIVACLVELTGSLVRPGEAVRRSDYTATVVFLLAATIVFALIMNVIGGYAAMIAFLLVTLAVLNRGRWVQNVAIALVLPTAIHLLFDFWLRAAIPRGTVFAGWLT